MFFFSIRRRHTSCALVTGVQTCALPIFGLRQQRFRGEGTEFEALAEYQPGMDRRAIDWNASARHVKLLAKEYRVERDNRVVLAIDSGRTMAEPVGCMPRVARAVSAALLLAYVGPTLNDRLSPFS